MCFIPQKARRKGLNIAHPKEMIKYHVVPHKYVLLLYF